MWKILIAFEVRERNPLICVGCSVQYWMSCAINKGGFLEFAFASTHMCLGSSRLFTFCLTLTR